MIKRLDWKLLVCWTCVLREFNGEKAVIRNTKFVNVGGKPFSGTCEIDALYYLGFQQYIHLQMNERIIYE